MMSSQTNPIKTLVQRFVSLEPAVRMKVTKKLLELYSSAQAAREVVPSNSCSALLKKSFLEQFWDEVEKAHGDNSHAVNPFTQQRRAKGRDQGDAPASVAQDGFFNWLSRPSDLFALL
jgi:hypothetical protein